jgi:hypothetical protein
MSQRKRRLTGNLTRDTFATSISDRLLLVSLARLAGAALLLAAGRIHVLTSAGFRF